MNFELQDYSALNFNKLGHSELKFNGNIVWSAGYWLVKEGYPLTLTNSLGKDLKDYKIYGNSVQDGTPTPDTPIEVESVGERTVNLFDVNTYPFTTGRVIWGHSGLDGAVDGYACTLTYIPCIDLQGKTITINHTKGANTGIAFYDDSKTYISGVRYNNETIKTVTVPNNAIYYRFCVDINYINEIQIQEGDTVTEYEPYGYKIPVKTSGINLHNHKLFNYKETTTNGITFTPLGDGTFRVKGKLTNTSTTTSYRVVKTTAIPVEAGTYRSKPQNSSSIGVMFGVYKKATNTPFWLNINSTSNSGITTLSEDAYVGYCQIFVRAGTTYEIDEIIYPQLTKGTTDYPYQPYVEPITTNIYLDEPLKEDEYISYSEDSLPVIPTHKGTNIIEVDTTIEPSNIEATYKSSKKI